MELIKGWGEGWGLSSHTFERRDQKYRRMTFPLLSRGRLPRTQPISGVQARRAPDTIDRSEPRACERTKSAERTHTPPCRPDRTGLLSNERIQSERGNKRGKKREKYIKNNAHAQSRSALRLSSIAHFTVASIQTQLQLLLAVMRGLDAFLCFAFFLSFAQRGRGHVVREEPSCEENTDAQGKE